MVFGNFKGSGLRTSVWIPWSFDLTYIFSLIWNFILITVNIVWKCSQLLRVACRAVPHESSADTRTTHVLSPATGQRANQGHVTYWHSEQSKWSRLLFSTAPHVFWIGYGSCCVLRIRARTERVRYLGGVCFVDEGRVDELCCNMNPTTDQAEIARPIDLQSSQL